MQHPVVKLKFSRRHGFFLEGNTRSIMVQLQAMMLSLTLGIPAPWPWFVPSKARWPIFFVVKPETRSFTFFLYSLELQSSMIQKEHPYTVFLISKRMCKYSLGQMWQSLSTCTLVHRAFPNTKWITQSRTCTRSYLTLFRHRLWLPVHISFLIWHQNNIPVTLHFSVLCLD